MKILAFPKDPNPYQELLYNEVRKHGITVSYLEAPFNSATAGQLFRPIQLLKYRLKGFSHFHIHWLYSFKFAIKNKCTDNIITKTFFTLYFILLIYWIRVLGYKIIWTVHNITPHEKTFLNDLKVTQFLVRHIDLCIVHSQQTIDEMQNKNIRPVRTEIIPIGSYIGVYPNTIPQNVAREKLGIPRENFVFGFVGRIEPYKGVSEVIKAFKKIKHSYTSLLIAGPCINQKLRQEIENDSLGNGNILLRLEYIPDKDMQLYLNASDVITLPFKQITTSSTIILASSFARAVVYPDLGNLKDLPENIGIKYDPLNEDALAETLMNIRKKECIEFGNNGYRFANNISWKLISNKFIRALT